MMNNIAQNSCRIDCHADKQESRLVAPGIAVDKKLENTKQKIPMLKSKRAISISTFNVQTLNRAAKSNDLALLSDKIGNTEKLLKILETAPTSAGLYMNTTKTKFNEVNTEGTITAQNGCDLEHVNDFNYIGSKIISSEK